MAEMVRGNIGTVYSRRALQESDGSELAEAITLDQITKEVLQRLPWPADSARYSPVQLIDAVAFAAQVAFRYDDITTDVRTRAKEAASLVDYMAGNRYTALQKGEQ